MSVFKLAAWLTFSWLTLVYLGVVFVNRINAVTDFRLKLGDIIYKWADQEEAEGVECGWRWDVLESVSFERMLFEFWKPLHVEQWYPDRRFLEP